MIDSSGPPDPDHSQRERARLLLTRRRTPLLETEVFLARDRSREGDFRSCIGGFVQSVQRYLFK